MSAVFPNQGIDYLTQHCLKKATIGTLTLCLFTNDYTPVDGSTYGNFTEPTDGSYDGIALAGGTWTGSTTDGVSTYTYPNQTFSFMMGMGTTVYGWFIADVAAEKVICAERFATAKTLAMGADTLTMNLTWKSRDFTVT